MLLYTFAWIGCSVAYVPFLTVLLPARVDQLAEGEAVRWLAYISFTGAIAASVANIGFGWLSDVLRSRRSVAGTGMVLTCGLLITTGTVESLPALLAVIACWQLALNMMLSPIAAWAGDCVPDHQKGRLGGLLSMAPAAGAMAGILVTTPGLVADQERLWIVALMVAVCVLPALFFASPRPFPGLMTSPLACNGDQPPARVFSKSAARMWVARLLIQIIEVALFSYLFLWLRSLSGTVSDNDTAWVFSAALVIGIPLAMMAGRWADRQNRPIAPLGVSAVFTSLGLLIMA
ncbi:MAG: MFS transporter, partial [Pseudomonadota bacterium]